MVFLKSFIVLGSVFGLVFEIMGGVGGRMRSST